MSPLLLSETADPLALACGFLTMIIRLKGGSRGRHVCDIIMNCFAPLIDRSFKRKSSAQ